MKKQYTSPFMKTPAQRDLAKSIKDYKIWLHLLEYGDPVDDGFHAISRMAIALHPAIKDKTDAAKLLEGIRIFKEATEFNAWRKSYTVAVNDAMDVILRLFPTLPGEVRVRALIEALQQSA